MTMAQQLPPTDVYVPRSLQLWRNLITWLAFFFQIFLQIVKGTPSMYQFLSSSSPAFKPLPIVELPCTESPPAAEVSVHGDLINRSDDNSLEKLTIVLDLDETLICAYETSSLPATAFTQATEAGLKSFELECISSDKECEGKPKINYVTVFERPGLQEFLKQIGEFADLVLFTAGLEGYARPLFDKIDVENRFLLRLYRPSTVSTKYRENVKDISCLSRDLCRTVIVDNNPFSFLLQPLNGIPCIPFSAGHPYDTQMVWLSSYLVTWLNESSRAIPTAFHEHSVSRQTWQLHGINTSLSRQHFFLC